MAGGAAHWQVPKTGKQSRLVAVTRNSPPVQIARQVHSEEEDLRQSQEVKPEKHRQG